MPKINVYLSDELAAAVRDLQVPVSAVCQSALERAVREVTALRADDEAGGAPRSGRGKGGAPYERWTGRARSAMSRAQQAARAHGHDHIGTEHVLLGMLDEGGNLALRVLGSLEIEVTDLR